MATAIGVKIKPANPRDTIVATMHVIGLLKWIPAVPMAVYGSQNGKRMNGSRKDMLWIVVGKRQHG